MREEVKTVIVIAVIASLIGAGYLAIHSMSGVSPPFTVVESQSMQHSRESEIGIIDTGDLILVKSPSKTSITSYVEGYADDYSKFGEYGDVIIYKRDNRNPVIHRAIVWLDYDDSIGKWSAPSLAGYSNDLWVSNNGNDYSDLAGTFTFTLKYKAGYEKTVSIDIDTLQKKSGYLTMGDNPENNYFDQRSIVPGRLISVDGIRSVAWKEIPWLGSLKLYFNGNTGALDNWAPNSLPNLCAAILTIILTIGGTGFAIDEFSLMRARRKLGL
ncbi:Signal peptidase I [Thermoplasmatales archaeon BRNA1]|nr:Signal peptidase I [Thermoplasmatales archaeon BRNA1]